MPFEFITDIKDAILAFERENEGLTLFIVFALGFAESIALVSLFVPSTLLFLVIGAAHNAAGGSFLPIWLAGSAGAFAGDIISYAIGAYYKDGIRDVWPFRANPHWMVKAKEFDVRWGAMSIVGSKFLGMLRPFAPVMAGSISMPWFRFLAASAFSSLLWAGLFLSPGYGFSWLSG